MDKTVFRDALQWGVLSVLAIAQFPPASAEPVTLTTDVMDSVSAGTDASSLVVAGSATGTNGQVSVVTVIDGKVTQRTCQTPCTITVQDGVTKVIPGTPSNQVVGSAVALAAVVSTIP